MIVPQRINVERIEPMLYRHPDLDPASLRRSVEASLGPVPEAQ